MVWWNRYRILFLSAITICIISNVSFSQSSYTVGLEYDSKGQPTHIIVRGIVDSPMETYLGISFYPEGTTDALTQGKHSWKAVPPKKDFIEKVPLKDVKTGTYEVSLWDKKIPRNLATDNDNYFVKLWGFHLDGQKSYSYGTIMPIK